ncbi:MAG: sel1 repeat family protein [Acholeplasmatales bacterium]|nr:sel1 repeat family protein [Acholeplasmatales bacterium]
MKEISKYTKLALKAMDDKNFTDAITLLEEALSNNDFDASSYLAMIYLTGLNGEVDEKKGMKYLLEGAANDDPKSLAALGDVYYTGKNVEKDLNQAKEYYLEASKYDEAHSIGMLGLFEYNEENYEKAVEYFKKSATYLDQNAMYYLALCAYNGQGMEKNYELSFMLFDKLYELNENNRIVIKYLADMYFNGYGIDKDLDEAKKLYEKLDDDESIFNLALIYKNYLKEYEKALPLFKRVKSVESQFEQGIMLYNGLGIDENKNEAYFKFYACAMSKYIYSYPFVGDCYYYGYGVKKNYEEAIKWYEFSINENLPNQYLNIAFAYMKLKKYDEAIKCLELEKNTVNKYKALAEVYLKLKKYSDAYNAYLEAANLNDSYSTYEVSKMLKKGKGIKKDKELASKYYFKYLELIALEDNENK